MKTIRFAFALSLSYCIGCATAPDELDIRPEASTDDTPTAVEWQKTNDRALSAATSPEELKRHLVSSADADALLRNICGAYRTDPLVATKIAAVTQFVMSKNDAETRRRRVLWRQALLRAVSVREDAYCRIFLLDQLRWCGANEDTDRIVEIGNETEERSVKDMVKMVVEHIRSQSTDPFGKWALQLPYGCFNAGCLDIGRSLTGEPQALLLWRGGSPIVVPVAISDNRISFVCESNRVVLEAEGDRLSGTMNGDKPIRGWRIEPIGARPDLSEAQFGKAENLLAEGMDGFLLMGEKSGWTFADGVLSNHVERDADGKRIGHYGNLVSKRSDFFDFNLKCDVRVPTGSNSGIYLRGIYEIQVIDSFGKPLDQHGMGALYGRIAPSVAAERKPGEWQTLDITLWRRHLTVVLNGVTIIDNKPVEGVTGGALTPDESKPGPIYLQGDHSDADYRNLVLTKILN